MVPTIWWQRVATDLDSGLRRNDIVAGEEGVPVVPAQSQLGCAVV
jgi:hypothetical protein